VKDQIVLFHLALSGFTLLVIAWFGAGLIAEDRRTERTSCISAAP
jgi:hypothetical protein